MGTWGAYGVEFVGFGLWALGFGLRLGLRLGVWLGLQAWASDWGLGLGLRGSRSHQATPYTPSFVTPSLRYAVTPHSCIKIFYMLAMLAILAIRANVVDATTPTTTPRETESSLDLYLFHCKTPAYTQYTPYTPYTQYTHVIIVHTVRNTLSTGINLKLNLQIRFLDRKGKKKKKKPQNITKKYSQKLLFIL